MKKWPNIYLPELKYLYNDMRSNKISTDRFSFKLKKISFDVIFLIDRSPFELLFGVKKHNLSFVLKVLPGFMIETIPNDVFYQLRDMLEIIPWGTEKFTSKMFIKYFANNIPKQHSGITVQPDEIAIYRKNDISEEQDKIYFFGWLPHTLKNGNVTQENLAKTKLLLGEATYDYCKKNNISSRWTDNKLDRIPYYRPTKSPR